MDEFTVTVYTRYNGINVGYPDEHDDNWWEFIELSNELVGSHLTGEDGYYTGIRDEDELLADAKRKIAKILGLDESTIEVGLDFDHYSS